MSSKLNRRTVDHHKDGSIIVNDDQHQNLKFETSVEYFTWAATHPCPVVSYAFLYPMLQSDMDKNLYASIK